jgi:hypothetical protein
MPRKQSSTAWTPRAAGSRRCAPRASDPHVDRLRGGLSRWPTVPLGRVCLRGESYLFEFFVEVARPFPLALPIRGYLQ